MADCGCDSAESLERRTLLILLSINGAMFVFEGIAGWVAESTSLMADSLDMLADASVYGIALYAVGRSARIQSRTGSASGFMQIALGIGVVVDVFRRYAQGSEPVGGLIMSIGGVALAANIICLVLLAKHREGGIHMRASWIFSTNDVIANISVILSGALVGFFESRIPDLVIGLLIAMVVVRGGVRIIQETRKSRSAVSAGPDHEPQ